MRGDSPAPPDGDRVLARAISLNVAGQIGGFAIGFFSAILLARLLGPADRGLLAVMTVVSAVALALSGAGLQTAAQYYASRRETPQRALLGNNLAYGLVLAAVFVPAFWLLRGPIAHLFADGRGGLVWVLAALLVPLAFLNFTASGQLCGRLEFGLWNLLLIASRLVSLVCVGVLVALAGLGVAGGILAAAAGSAIVVAGSTVRLLREGRPLLDRRLFSANVRYGVKAQIGSLFQFLNFRLDLLVLGLFAPLASVGYYAVAATLAELVTYLGIAFQISVLPIVSRGQGNARRAETSRAAVRHHSVLALVLVAANAVFAPLVLLYGYGDAFRPALLPLLILLPGMWFVGTGNLVVGDLRGRGRPGLASTVKGVSALLTVGLDVALIPPFGVTGAALASLVSYAFFGSVSLLVLSRVSGVPVRKLAVPTRGDLALYPRTARAAVGRLRRASRSFADALAAGRA